MQTKHRHFSKKLFLINANWTSLHQLEGWKHYRIASRRKSAAGKWELEMMAVCDRQVRVWVSRASLRNPELWKPGWHD
jgi:tryptophan-rich hypothetical protein